MSLMALMLTASSTAVLAGKLPSSTTINPLTINPLSDASQVCGTDENKQDWNALQKENQLQLKKRLTQSMRKMTAPQVSSMAVNGNGVPGRYYIPVVVHVYGDEYNCTDENSACLTESKIIDGLNKSNEDFLGTNTEDGPIAPEFQAIRENLNIEFVLAKKDPQGNPTNGIVRYGTKAGYGDGEKFNDQIAADAWDNFKYMNLYLMSDLYDDGTTSSSGVAWYPQMSMSQAGLARVVYNGNFLGTNTGENFRSVLTHEFGHWLNLPHTFDGDVCSIHQEAFCDLTGDNNCDTPQMSSSILQNNAPNCLGQSTNTENFMHYSDNYAMYTKGQVERMTAALHGDARSTLWTNSNLIAVGLEEYTSNSPHIWDGSGLDTEPSGELLNQFTNLNATKGETTTFEVNIPQGTGAAAIYLKGFNQDPDLYVSKGVAPTKNGDTWIADFISFKSAGTPELVTISSPSSNQAYFVTVDAFSDYSNATLDILSVEDPSLCSSCERVFLAEETNLSAIEGAPDKSYQFNIPDDATRVVAVLAGGYQGDPDMYVSRNSIPTTEVADCAPFSAPRLSEYCDLGAGGGAVNVIIDPFLDYSNATFRVYYERDTASNDGLPTAEANGAYNGTINEVINFSSAGSVDTDGIIVNYNWDFGDGGASDEANPAYVYTTSGVFSATLTVTDNDNNQATDSSIVNISAINAAPVAQINGPFETFVNNNINFSSEGSFDSDGIITNYFWDFGDGNTSSDINPDYRYNTPGNYSVQLTVTDDDGAVNSVSSSVVINPNVIEYCSISGNTGYEWIASVSAGGITNSSNKEGYADFTDININLTSGNNQVDLTAGGNYSEFWGVWIDLNNNGDFEAAEQLLSVSGTNTVTGNIAIDNNLVGVTARMRVVMKYGSAPTSACGAIGDGEAEDYQITIIDSGNAAPIAEANGEYITTLGNPLTFNSNGSIDTDGDIVSYQWDFGNGEQSSNANPTYVYPAAGNYVATLTVTDNDGASQTDTASVTIDLASLDFDDACATQSPISGGNIIPGQSICLSNNNVMWFNIGDVSSYQTIAIKTGYGQGNLDILYKNGGWPSDSNYDGKSSGNGETTTCLSVAAGNDYWSYLKVTGGASNASIVVEFDSASCQ